MSEAMSNPDDEKFMQVMVLRSRSLKRVMYLECGKDCADILLSLLVMPMGAILKILKETDSAKDIKQGLCNLYTSVENLNQSTLSVNKSILLDPSSSSGLKNFLCGTEWVRKSCANSQCSSETLVDNQLCSDCKPVTRLLCRNVYSHDDGQEYLEVQPETNCRSCGSALEKVDILQSKPEEILVTSAARPHGHGNSVSRSKGFVKEDITYMVKEDLSIVKSSTISSVALLKNWNVNSFDDLETKEIRIGRKEGLLLVRSALTSSQPLTDVFEHFF